MTMTDSPELTQRWVCIVARSGYHNGSHCTASDPHDGWGCGWRWEVSLTEEEYAAERSAMDAYTRVMLATLRRAEALLLEVAHQEQGDRMTRRDARELAEELHALGLDATT